MWPSKDAFDVAFAKRTPRGGFDVHRWQLASVRVVLLSGRPVLPERHDL